MCVHVCHCVAQCEGACVRIYIFAYIFILLHTYYCIDTNIHMCPHVHWDSCMNVCALHVSTYCFWSIARIYLVHHKAACIYIYIYIYRFWDRKCPTTRNDSLPAVGGWGSEILGNPKIQDTWSKMQGLNSNLSSDVANKMKGLRGGILLWTSRIPPPPSPLTPVFLVYHNINVKTNNSSGDNYPAHPPRLMMSCRVNSGDRELY